MDEIARKLFDALAEEYAKQLDLESSIKRVVELYSGQADNPDWLEQQVRIVANHPEMLGHDAHYFKNLKAMILDRIRNSGRRLKY